MKPYYLRDIQTYVQSTSNETQSMIDTTQQRRIDLPDGTRGFIVGATVLAPFYYDKSVVAQKDGKDIVLTFKERNRFGLSIMNLPFNIPCEPLSFRHTKIHKDTFFFRVFDQVTICRGFSMTDSKGKLEVRTLSDFCPVYDRFGHLLGMNAGMFCNNLFCIPIRELI